MPSFLVFAFALLSPAWLAPQVGSPRAKPKPAQWLVTFDSSYDLLALERAIRARNPAAAATAVAALERQKATRHRAFYAAVERLDGQVVESWWLVDGCAILVPGAAVDRLRAMPGVARIQLDAAVGPTGWTASCIKDATSAGSHNADSLQQRGLLGGKVGLAVIDTGLDISMGATKRPHRSFYVDGDPRKKLRSGIGGFRILVARALGKMPADDVLGHGTAVGAIAGGEVWLTPRADRGHAPRATLFSYSIANDRQGNSSFATIVTAWQRVVADAARGIHVVLHAYSGSPNPLNIGQMALDQAARTADLVCVVSGGNGAASTRSSQAAANGVAVGAVYAKGRRVVWPLSSRGPIFGDQRTFPDLVANGVGTVTPAPDNERKDQVLTGTSMAAAQVAGAALLLRSAFPRMNALGVKAALLATAEDVSRQNPLPPYNSHNAYGMGYLRDDRLLAFVRRSTTLVLSSALIRSAARSTRVIRVQPGKTYVAVLAWNRLDVRRKAWSNLDLVARSGTTVVAESRSTRRLYERIYLHPSAAGKIAITVLGTSLSQAKVPFTLVVGEVPSPFRRPRVAVFGNACPGSSAAQVGASAVAPRAAQRVFGNTASIHGLGWKPHRLQQVFAADAVPSTFFARALQFRQDDRTFFTAVRNYWARLEISLGLTRKSPLTIASSFRANRTDPMTVVLPSTRVNLPDFVAVNKSATNWNVRIPLARPFVYAATAERNLLLDIVHVQNAAGNSSAYYYVDAVLDRTTYPVSRVFAATTTATRGFVGYGFGAVVGFLEPLANAARPRLEWSGEFVVGRPVSLQVAQAPARTVGLIYLGFSDRRWGAFRLPLDLTKIGAPGCAILTGALVTAAVVTDGHGVGRLRSAVPALPGLVGATVFYQGMLIDLKANQLGLTFTNGLRVVFGG